AGLFVVQAEGGIRGFHVTGVQTCALPISRPKKDTDTESTTTTEAPTPRKRGRPRKNPEADAPETVVAAAADGAVEAEAPSEPAEIGSASCRESVELAAVVAAAKNRWRDTT